MKVGILTFQFAINYGAVLQCYSLQQFLKESGHKTSIINFVPPAYGTNNSFTKNILLSIRDSVLKPVTQRCFKPKLYKLQKKQKHEFNIFRNKYLNLTKHYVLRDIKNLSDDFDAIVVGSDQIWNPSQHYHGVYFLYPLIKFNGLRISYAPCCALNEINELNKNKIKESLKKFSSISVRNQETRNFVSDLINYQPKLVVDPVMLYNFKALIKSRSPFKQPYILIYVLGSEIDGGHDKVISEIKKENGDFLVCSICLKHNRTVIRSTDEVLYNCSVEEWINLFYHASFIYTDSYHGVLFSIKFKKKFVAYYKDKMRASRFIDLIKRYNLDLHIITDFDDGYRKKSFNGEIDYQRIESAFSLDIEQSKSFLSKALSI